jgi:hypothetical protein
MLSWRPTFQSNTLKKIKIRKIALNQVLIIQKFRA